MKEEVRERGEERKRRRSRSRSRSPGRRSFGGDRRGGGNSRREMSKMSDTSDKMVYISNVPYDVRWMELKDLVREKAGEVSFVEMLETPDGLSKGCAVVEFKDAASAKKCVEVMHRMEMKDRYVVVKEIRDPSAFFRKVKEDIGVDFLANRSGHVGGMPSRGGGGGRDRDMVTRGPQHETYGLSTNFLHQLGIDGPLCERVFVANLPYNVQSGKIYEVFTLAGNVASVDLHMDKEGKSKGLAVVEYSHPIEAVQSISMLNNKRLFDRTLTVKMDKYEKPRDLDRRPGELPTGLREVGMGLGANGAPLTNITALLGQVSSPPQQQQQQPPPQQQPQMNYQQPALVGGVGQNMMSSGVGGGSNPGFFGGGGGNNSAFSSGGFGSGVGAGNNSVVGGGGAFGGYPGNSGPIDTGPNSSGPFMGSSMGSNMGSSMGSNMGSNSQRNLINSNEVSYVDRMRDYDMSRSRSPMGGSNRQQASRVIVIKNLPMDYTWQMVRERLRPFGDVEFADMVGPGAAKARFKSLMDADRAWAQLNGMSVEGRPITVEFGFE